MEMDAQGLTRVMHRVSLTRYRLAMGLRARCFCTWCESCPHARIAIADNMSFDQHQLPSHGSARLPIPRLEPGKERARNPPSLRQSRVPKACLSCRTRKVKCNGARPKCQNCREGATPCVYVASRKDRLKTLVLSLSSGFNIDTF